MEDSKKVIIGGVVIGVVALAGWLFLRTPVQATPPDDTNNMSLTIIPGQSGG